MNPDRPDKCVQNLPLEIYGFFVSENMVVCADIKHEGLSAPFFKPLVYSVTVLYSQLF